MNIDTDMQFAFMTGIRDYFNTNSEYLKSQIGNLTEVIFQTKNIMTLEFG